MEDHQRINIITNLFNINFIDDDILFIINFYEKTNINENSELTMIRYNNVIVLGLKFSSSKELQERVGTFFKEKIKTSIFI